MQEPLEQFKRGVGRPRRNAEPEDIRELRKQGLSFRQIARKTGYGYGTVRRAYLSREGGTSRASE